MGDYRKGYYSGRLPRVLTERAAAGRAVAPEAAPPAPVESAGRPYVALTRSQADDLLVMLGADPGGTPLGLITEGADGGMLVVSLVTVGPSGPRLRWDGLGGWESIGDGDAAAGSPRERIAAELRALGVSLGLWDPEPVDLGDSLTLDLGAEPDLLAMRDLVDRLGAAGAAAVRLERWVCGSGDEASEGPRLVVGLPAGDPR